MEAPFITSFCRDANYRVQRRRGPPGWCWNVCSRRQFAVDRASRHGYFLTRCGLTTKSMTVRTGPTSRSRIDFVDRALALNPNSSATWLMGGFLRVHRGASDEAITWIERSMRLSPLNSDMFRMRTGLALAQLIARRFDAASAWAAKVVSRRAGTRPARGGRRGEPRARRASRRGAPRLAAGAQAPSCTPAWRIRWAPVQRPEDLATLEEGLRSGSQP